MWIKIGSLLDFKNFVIFYFFNIFNINFEITILIKIKYLFTKSFKILNLINL